jgi:hypothetical protein
MKLVTIDENARDATTVMDAMTEHIIKYTIGCLHGTQQSGQMRRVRAEAMPSERACGTAEGRAYGSHAATDALWGIRCSNFPMSHRCLCLGRTARPHTGIKMAHETK